MNVDRRSTKRSVAGPVQGTAVAITRPRPEGSRVIPVVRFAFFVFVLSIPLEYPDRTIPLEVHTITGSLLLLVALLQPRLCFRRPPAAFWWFVGFLWAYACTMLFVQHIDFAAKLFLNFLLVALLFWVGYNIMSGDDTVARQALTVFVAGCAVAATLNVLDIATKVNETDETLRRVIFGQNADLFGGNMALGLIALMALTIRPNAPLVQRRTILALPVVYVLLKSLMLSSTRGAMLALVIGVFAYMSDTRGTRTLLRNVVVALLVVVALAYVVYRNGSMFRRYQLTVTTGSMSGREELMPVAWGMVLERPLFGWGPVDYGYELGKRTSGFTIGKHNADGVSAEPDKAVHNLVLDTLASVGFVGGFPFFMAIGLCLYAAWKARHGPAGAGPLAIALVMTMIAMSGNWEAAKSTWFVFAYAASRARPRMANRVLISLRPVSTAVMRDHQLTPAG